MSDEIVARVIARPVSPEMEARRAEREESQRRAREWAAHYERVRDSVPEMHLRKGYSTCPGGSAGPMENYGTPHSGGRWFCPVCGYRVKITSTGWTAKHTWKGMKP